MISASSLPRLDVCPASGALPKVQFTNAAMSKGSVVHDYLDHCHDNERDAALALVPAEHRDFCAEIDLSRLPFDIRAPYVFPEVAYAYNVATGASRYIGQRIGRNYGQLAATEIPGSMDVLISEQDHVGVWDYKVGFGIDLLAPPPARNLQLKDYALSAARFARASSASIGRIRITENAEVHVDEPVTLDAFDLDDIADHLDRIHASVAKARELVLSGRTPNVTETAHCAYCPAFTSCPAKTALVRQIASAPDEIEAMAQALTPDIAARAWERIRLVEDVVGRARKAVEQFAARTPIDLGNGKVLGLVETQRESVTPALALPVLREEFGEDVAAAAVEESISKARLRDALKGYAQRCGKPLAKVEREALALLREAGAIEVTTTESVKEKKA